MIQKEIHETLKVTIYDDETYLQMFIHDTDDRSVVNLNGKDQIRKLRDLCNKALGGEYICSKCGIRKDMNPKTEPEF